jgi:hypothetical protein
MADSPGTAKLEAAARKEYLKNRIFITITNQTVEGGGCLSFNLLTVGILSRKGSPIIRA